MKQIHRQGVWMQLPDQYINKLMGTGCWVGSLYTFLLLKSMSRNCWATVMEPLSTYFHVLKSWVKIRSSIYVNAAFVPEHTVPVSHMLYTNIDHLKQNILTFPKIVHGEKASRFGFHKMCFVFWNLRTSICSYLCDAALWLSSAADSNSTEFNKNNDEVL